MENSMTYIKWHDVAHMYLGSSVKMRDVGRFGHLSKDTTPNDIMGLTLLDRGDLQLKPVLRHRDDINWEDAIELEKYIYGDDGGIYIGYRSLRVAKLILRREDYEPRLFLWLISKGFDLFGLIESGQAIRKEVQIEQ